MRIANLSMVNRSRPPGGGQFITGLKILGTALLVAGCAQSKLTLSDNQKAVQAELSKVNPRTDPLPARTRIIDVHTHTFNSRYLPIEGVLLGKRDIAPVASLLSDSCAKALAQAVVDRTELAAAAGQPAIIQSGDFHLEPSGGWVCRVIIGLLNKAAAAGAWDKTKSKQDQTAALNSVATNMTFSERLAVRSTMQMMGMNEQTVDKGNPGLMAAVRFLWQLTQNDARMGEYLNGDYADAPKRGNIVMVSHMMDLGPVYDEAPRGTDLLDFGTAQVRRMEDFQNRPDSNLIYFVAYIPYRDHVKGAVSGDSLRLVQDAVEHHGAWGVKFYPPSGYRAAGNVIPLKPKTLNHYPQAQFKARYGALGPQGGKELDVISERLLNWCIEKDLPVFAHCATGEFEAREGYGVSNSDPKYWREFLTAHPAPDGSPCRLRLSLGHAGSGDYWYGYSKYASWGKEVAELCRDYPNVYCEITTHSELTDPDRQAFFAWRLLDEFAKDDAPNPGNTPRYKLRDKLMYGTDWYLPDAAKRSEVLLSTEEVFLHPQLKPYYTQYFSGNAARYLNLAGRLGQARSSAVRERLQPFVK